MQEYNSILVYVLTREDDDLAEIFCTKKEVLSFIYQTLKEEEYEGLPKTFNRFYQREKGAKDYRGFIIHTRFLRGTPCKVSFRI